MKTCVAIAMGTMITTSVAVSVSASGTDNTNINISKYRACEHSESYTLQDDSYESTDTSGGLRHYKCSECGAEYSYETDPMVYVDGFENKMAP